MEPFRAVDANNRGFKAQNGAAKCPYSSGCRFLHHFDEEQNPDPDPHQSEMSNPVPQHWLVMELYRVYTPSVLTLHTGSK
jgi:hypothetical protein